MVVFGVAGFAVEQVRLQGSLIYQVDHVVEVAALFQKERDCSHLID